MGWGTRTPTSNDRSGGLVDDFARRLSGAYREPVRAEPCKCRSYPKGTVFQQLDDDPGYYRCDSENPADRRYGQQNGYGDRRWVRMQHTPECIAERRADHAALNGQTKKIEVVACGQDYADGEWWCWK